MKQLIDTGNVRQKERVSPTTGTMVLKRFKVEIIGPLTLNRHVTHAEGNVMGLPAWALRKLIGRERI